MEVSGGKVTVACEVTVPCGEAHEARLALSTVEVKIKTKKNIFFMADLLEYAEILHHLQNIRSLYRSSLPYFARTQSCNGFLMG